MVPSNNFETNPFDPDGGVSNGLDCGLEVSSNFSCTITFTFELIPLGKA